MNRTRALFAAALAALLAAGLYCSSNHVPDVPVVPAGPAYCIKDTVYTFKTVATDPDGDSMALRFDWGDSTTTYWVGWFASGDTVAFTHAWSDTGNFEVRVLAQDRRLLTSDSSEGLRVLVALRRPPDAPIEPSGPDSGGWDSSYVFKTSASHPDGLLVAIRFAWGDGDTSDWTSFWFQNYPFHVAHAWSAPGTYAVTAQAKDTGELTSPWSPPHAIVVRLRDSSRLMMVGAAMLSPDSSGFLIHIVNEGTVEVTINSLGFFGTPESAYMRDFYVDGQPGYGFPVPSGQPGTGPGDTVYFAPVTIAPDMSQMVELMFLQFYVDATDTSSLANVHNKVFELRFSDGSVITVRP